MRKNKANVLSTLCANLETAEANTSTKEFTNRAIERPKYQNFKTNHNTLPIMPTAPRPYIQHNAIECNIFNIANNNMELQHKCIPVNNQFNIKTTGPRRALVKKNQ